MKKLLLGAAAITACMALTSSAHALPLTGWAEHSEFNGGSWSVSGETATQSGNNSPTFFLGSDSYLNTRFQGTFRVGTSSDDDLIGLVFGLDGDVTNGYDFTLFNWKQGAQSPHPEGFSLFQATDTFMSNINVIPGASSPNMPTLASDTGAGKGWADFVTYSYDVLYTANRITVDINGSTIFDVAGSFGAGQFGFFNHSQSQAHYTIDSIESVSVPLPATLLLMGVGIAGLAYARKGR